MTNLLRLVASAPRKARRVKKLLQGWIDFAPRAGCVGRELRVAGWCFLPGGNIREVRLLLGRDHFFCEAGQLREDVAAKYPGEVESRRCGFEVGVVPLRAWKGRLVIEAVTAGGEVLRVATAARLRVRNGPPILQRVCGRWLQRRAAAQPLAERSGRLRVMCFTNDLNITGGPLNLMEVVTELKRRGEIEPVVVSPVDGWLRKEFEGEGIEVLLRARPAGLGVCGDGRLRREMRGMAEEILRRKVDVVFGNTVESFHAIAAAKEAGIGSFWNVHESDPWREFFRWFSPVVSEVEAAELFSWPKRVMFASPATRAVYQELERAGNFYVAGNAIDGRRIERAATGHPREQARQRLGVGEKDVAILLLGTVCERKGQLDLVEALRLLPERWHKTVRCFIVGDRAGAYSLRLHESLAGLRKELRERITVVKETPATALYYRAADVFVCTSRVESYPRVILEAMHYGLPIVTTGVFGIRGQVQAGVNGIFYEPGDAGGLCDRLLGLLEDAGKRERLASHARKVLSGLGSFDEMVGIYGKVLREAAGRDVDADRPLVIS